MKIIITGSSGFIGYHVSKRLLEENVSVIGIDDINPYYDISLKEARLHQLKISEPVFEGDYEINSGSLTPLIHIFDNSFPESSLKNVIILANSTSKSNIFTVVIKVKVQTIKTITLRKIEK